MKTRLLTIYLILALSCSARGPRVISPEEYMGGAENVRMVKEARILSVEKVALSPIFEFRVTNGHVESKEIMPFMWDRVRPLKTEKGPVSISAGVEAHIKALLSTPYKSDGGAMGCGYLPTHRFRLEVPDHVAEIIVIDCYNALDLFVDGKRVGGRPGMDVWNEVTAMVREINALLDQTSKEPNQALEPTTSAVTARAGARAAPAGVVPHL